LFARVHRFRLVGRIAPPVFSLLSVQYSMQIAAIQESPRR
jgi:hypothetical protein